MAGDLPCPCPSDRRLRLNGIELNVHIEGEGEPVLLLHGFPDDHQVWRRTIPALVRAGFRVIAPDLRGCGLSEAPPREAGYHLSLLVGDVVALLDHLGIDRVRLVGHDWGALVGWALALRHPERVERYAALSVGHPASYVGAPLKQKLMAYYILLLQLRGVIETSLRARDWWLFRTLTRTPGEVDHWIARLSRPGRLTAAINYYRANFGLFFRRDWPRAVIPVMGLWSDGDFALCREQMTGTARWLNGPWRYHEIAGAGHWLQLDAPERVNALLSDFLQRTTP